MKREDRAIAGGCLLLLSACSMPPAALSDPEVIFFLKGTVLVAFGCLVMLASLRRG